MTEARIGRRPVTSQAAEAGLIRPEVSRPFPQVRLVPEQPQPKPEIGLKSPIAQEAARSVAGVRADLSQAASVDSKQNQSQKRDLYAYIQEKVAQGELTSDQGMQILGMGKNEAERQAVLQQIQAEERQQEMALKEAGIYEQVKRITEIQREIPSTIIPIEGGAKRYAFDDPNHKHPYQEWRSPDALKPTTFRQRVWHAATSPRELLFESKYPLVDVIFVTNIDGTQTRYVDRAQIAPGVMPEPGVYKEIYSKPDKWGRRKLVSRELVGDNIIQTGWNTDTPGKEKTPLYGVATDKYNNLVAEELTLQSEIMAKQEQAILEHVNFGGTDYLPAKKYKKGKKFLEDTIDNMLWSQKDTPKDKAIFAARSFISNSAFYFLYQDFLPTANPAMQALAVGGYNVGNQLMLFNWKDFGRYAWEHKISTGVRLALPIGFILLPTAAKIPASLAFIVGQRALGPAIQKYNTAKEFKKFAAENPEIGSKEILKEQFEHPATQQKRALDMFARDHKEWYEQLKKLNPDVPDLVVKQAMTLKARSYHTGTQELQQILTVVAGEAGLAGLIKYLAVPAFLNMPISMLLAQTGLSPLVDHILSAMALSGASTIWSMSYLNKTMGRVKKDLAETHPELIPELRRKNAKLQRLQQRRTS